MQKWYFNPTNGAYTGDRISFDDPEISDPPSSRHVYKDGAWVVQLWYDWQGLKTALRGSVFFALAFGTTNANAFSLLNSTFDSLSKPNEGLVDSNSANEGKMQDLTFAIAQVRLGMPTDYTSGQLTELRALLEEYGFPVFL